MLLFCGDSLQLAVFFIQFEIAPLGVDNLGTPVREEEGAVFEPQNMTDLKGKKFGIWSTATGAFRAIRAATLEIYGMDLKKETQIIEAAPPTLFGLFRKGDLDAMVNVSGLTIAPSRTSTVPSSTPVSFGARKPVIRSWPR